MGNFLSVRPVDQLRRQLALRICSRWYYAGPGVDVLARRIRLASNRRKLKFIARNYNKKQKIIQKIKIDFLIARILSHINLKSLIIHDFVIFYQGCWEKSRNDFAAIL